jgi:CheY-like chemotaxis protein
MNILVADKDDAVLSSITKRIQEWGYPVEKSNTGQNVLQVVEEASIDLVLLDLSLPDMAPRDLIPKLKELRPHIGVITMTGSNTQELENEIRTLGIVYYMLKPINEETLKDLLDHFSKRKRSP